MTFTFVSQFGANFEIKFLASTGNTGAKTVSCHLITEDNVTNKHAILAIVELKFDSL